MVSGRFSPLLFIYLFMVDLYCRQARSKGIRLRMESICLSSGYFNRADGPGAGIILFFLFFLGYICLPFLCVLSCSCSGEMYQANIFSLVLSQPAAIAAMSRSHMVPFVDWNDDATIPGMSLARGLNLGADLGT